MLMGFDSIIKEQQAVYSQTEFLRECATKWKDTPKRQETDQETLTQLAPTIFYLKEGLGEIYKKEEEFLLSTLGSSVADEIKMKHQQVINIIDGIYRSVISFRSEMEKLNKELIWDGINGICQTINQLCREENQFSYLKSMKS